MSTLYDEDVVLWSEQQARLLREAVPSRHNEPIDWENVAEEIDSLGKSQISEVRTRLTRIIEHVLKLQFSPSQEPRRAWRETVLQQRIELESVLEDSPSLRGRMPELAEWAAGRGARSAAQSLRSYGEHAAAAAVLQHGGRYTIDELLDAWPPEPDATGQ